MLIEIFSSTVPIIIFIIDSQVQIQSLLEFIILNFVNDDINQGKFCGDNKQPQNVDAFQIFNSRTHGQRGETGGLNTS